MTKDLTSQGSSKKTVWLKLGKHFLDWNTIDRVMPHGEGTRILFHEGTELFIQVPYKKVISLLPPTY